MMDVAVPANIRQGLRQEEVARRGWAYSAEEAKGLVGRTDVALIDLREKAERERAGAIRVRCTPPTPICRTISTTAASSMSSPRPARRSFSTAPSANVPPWRSRRRRTRG